MSRSEITEFFKNLEKSRAMLYGLLIVLLVLLFVITSQLFKAPEVMNLPSAKSKPQSELIPIKSGERLFVLNLKDYTPEYLKTNIASPFFTDRFKPAPAQTNAPPPPPPPPPQFYKVQVKYMGMIENSSGIKKAFFLVNSNIVAVVGGMPIYTNVVVVRDFNPKAAVLTCMDKTNVLLFNKECELDIPINR
ncbi:MAG: hypothetical protein ACP5K7_07630 [Verrucomicrobiia bacterium]|jgi:hypothetical protein